MHYVVTGPDGIPVPRGGEIVSPDGVRVIFRCIDDDPKEGTSLPHVFVTFRTGHTMSVLASAFRLTVRARVWAARKDVSDLWAPNSVTTHRRIQVITDNGRRIEFEQIHWINGSKTVTAYDATNGRMVHSFWSNSKS